MQKKKQTKFQPQPGDLVFAKLKGYPAWPARVESQGPNDKKLSNGKFPVFFFGTHERGIIANNDLHPFFENKQKLGTPKKHRGFNQGMEEIEMEFSSLDETMNEITSNGKEESAPEDVINEPEETNVEATNNTSAQESFANDEKIDEEFYESNASDTDEHSLMIDISASTKKTKAKATSLRRAPRRIKEQLEESQNTSSTPVSLTTPLTPSSTSIRRPRKRSGNESIVTQVETPPVTPEVEYSRSGRLIKRKKLDDYEENDTYERKRKPDVVKVTAKPKNSEVEPSPNAAETIEQLNEEDCEMETCAKEEVEKGKETSSRRSSIQESDSSESKLTEAKEENGVLDIKSQERLEKLKRKLEEKEREKEMRKIEKFEQKRLERLEKLRSITVTVEMLRDIETEIIDSLNVENTNIDRCLHVLNKLDMLQITEENLYTYKNIVATLKKCRKYKNEKVRQKSEMLLNKFKQVFIGEREEKGVNTPTKNSTSEASKEITPCANLPDKQIQDVRELLNDMLNKVA